MDGLLCWSVYLMALRLIVLASILLIGAPALGQQGSTQEEREEAAKEARNWGMNRMTRYGREAADEEKMEEKIDDSRYWMDPKDRPPGDTKIYLQYTHPEFGSEKSEETLATMQAIAGSPEQCRNLQGEAWAECYEEHQATPAEIQRLADDHNKQLREGESMNSEAFQLVEDFQKVQPDYQFWTPDDGYHDPIFRQAERLPQLTAQLYESLVGDCEAIDIPIYRTNQVHLSDIRTCNQIFAPDPDEFACQATREFEATRLQDRLIATITPLVSDAFCIEQAATAVAACSLSKCDEVGELEDQICKILECSGLDGEGLEICESGCATQGENAVVACETSGDGCDSLGTSTTQMCVTQVCGPIPTSACIQQCSIEGATAVEQCSTECGAAGSDAFDQCMSDAGNALYSGAANFTINAFGPTTTYAVETPEGQAFEIERTSYTNHIDSHDLRFFVANHDIEVDGGSGVVLDYGVAENNFDYKINVEGSGISQVRVYGALYRIDRNEIEGCDAYMDSIADNFCTGSMQCQAPIPSCLEVSPGVTVCNSGPSSSLLEILAPWHAQSQQALILAQSGEIVLEELVPRLCPAAVSGPLECGFYLGAGEGDENCYIDASGVQRCIIGEGLGLEPLLGPEPYLDNCRVLYEREQNEECVRRQDLAQCVEGGEGLVSGRCYVPDVVYDCGTTEWFEQEVATNREISCEGGELMCLGSECVAQKESHADFNQAVEATSILRGMEMDNTCFQENGDTPIEEIGEDCLPAFFRGEPLECKIPIGSNVGVTPNCCEEGRDAAQDEGFTNYMDAMAATYSAGTAPSDAETESTFGSKDRAVGAHINTPDWMEVRAGTVYLPPGGDDDEGGRGGDLKSGQQVDTAVAFDRNLEGRRRANEDEGNYVTRPHVTPFEGLANQFGFVPTTPEQLAEAKHAARGGESPISFAKAVGLGAIGILPPEFSEQLFLDDGTPRWRRDGSILTFDGEGLEATNKAGAAAETDGGGGGSGSRSGSSIKSVGKAVSVAYQTYSLTKAIGHLVYQCEEDEIELGFAREARRCSYVGKYCKRRVRIGFIRVCIESREVHCCFNSSFSRIMVEQMRLRGMPDDPYGDFGSPKEPNCEGYSVEEISSLDMDDIDLSEWSTMQTMAGRFPDTSSERFDPPEGGGGSRNKRTAAGNFEDGRVTPRRMVSGSDLTPAGPQGLVSLSDRIADRSRRNFEAMEATREALNQRRTANYDPELISWYGKTTFNPDPPRNTGLELRDDLGEVDNSQLPLVCDTVRAPRPGTVELEYDVFGDLIGFTPPTSTHATGVSRWVNPDTNEYVAMLTKRPVRSRHAHLWIRVGSNWTGEVVPDTKIEYTLSVCPGDFSEEVGSGCRGSIDLSSDATPDETVLTSLPYWAHLRCDEIPYNRNYYVNVRMARPTTVECRDDDPWFDPCKARIRLVFFDDPI